MDEKEYEVTIREVLEKKQDTGAGMNWRQLQKQKQIIMQKNRTGGR